MIVYHASKLLKQMSNAAPYTQKRPAARHAYVALTALLVVYLVNFMDRQIFAVLQEEIRADLNLSDSQLALLGGTAFALFYASVGIPIAVLADRTNRIRLIAAACAVWSVFTALSGLATNFITMMLARIGVASGEAGGVSPSYSVISDYFPPSKRALAIGIFSIGAPLGLTAGSALGALIAEALSWRWAFVIVGAPGVLLALALIAVVREPKRGTFDSLEDSEPKKTAGAMDAFKLILNTPSLMLFTAAAAVTSFAGYALYQWAPSFLIRSQGLTLEEVGTHLSPLFALGLIGSIGGGWIADRLGPDRPQAYGIIPGLTLLLTVPFFLAALSVRDGMTSIALFGLPLLLSYAWIGPGLAATQTLTPPGQRAAVAALIGFFNNLIGIGLGPLAVGALSDALRSTHGEGEALRYALMSGSVMFVLAGGLFIAAGFALKADLKRRA